MIQLIIKVIAVIINLFESTKIVLVSIYSLTQHIRAHWPGLYRVSLTSSIKKNERDGKILHFSSS